MKDKIFLTGARRIGKSTVIDRVLTQLQCSIGGFRTGFADAEHTKLELVSLATDERETVMRRDGNGTRTVYAQGFDTLGVSALEGDAELLVADELGFLEEDARAFQSAVLRALCGDTPMLGVLRQDKNGWLDAVRSHPRVQLLTVNTENRDSIPAEVLEALAKLGLR